MPPLRPDGNESLQDLARGSGVAAAPVSRYSSIAIAPLVT